MEGPSADQVPVNHARLIHKNAAADFQVKSALGNRRHAASTHAISVSGNLNTVANTRDGFVGLEEVFRNANQIFVVPNVLRRSAAGEHDAGVVVRVHVGERDVGFDGVAFPFFGDGPAGFHFVHHHLVQALLRSSDDGRKAGFLQPVVRVHGVQSFGRVADDDENRFHALISASCLLM